MRNPNKPIPVIDDRAKSRDEITEMVKKMFETNENGFPEKEDCDRKTA